MPASETCGAASIRLAAALIGAELAMKIADYGLRQLLRPARLRRGCRSARAAEPYSVTLSFQRSVAKLSRALALLRIGVVIRLREDGALRYVAPRVFRSSGTSARVFMIESLRLQRRCASSRGRNLFRAERALLKGVEDDGQFGLDLRRRRKGSGFRIGSPHQGNEALSIPAQLQVHEAFALQRTRAPGTDRVRRIAVGWWRAREHQNFNKIMRAAFRAAAHGLLCSSNGSQSSKHRDRARCVRP